MDVKKIILIVVVVILLIAGLIMWGILSPPELVLVTDVSDLTVGQALQLKVQSFGLIQEYDFYFYASENPEIATITDNGVLIASNEGETILHIQSRENRRQHLTVKIFVKSSATNELRSQTDLNLLEISSKEDLPYFSDSDLNWRNKGSDVLSLATTVIASKKDAYLFSDVYQFADVSDCTLILLSDWTNDDVYLNAAVLNDFDMVSHLSTQLRIDENEINEYQIEDEYKDAAISLSKAFYNRQNFVKLSSLSPQYEYRVSIRSGYKVYMIVNYYNEGKITDIQSFLGSVQNYTPTTFLRSFTYSTTTYEIVIEDCALVIEKRLK